MIRVTVGLPSTWAIAFRAVSRQVQLTMKPEYDGQSLLAHHQGYGLLPTRCMGGRVDALVGRQIH